MGWGNCLSCHQGEGGGGSPILVLSYIGSLHSWLRYKKSDKKSPHYDITCGSQCVECMRVHSKCPPDRVAVLPYPITVTREGSLSPGPPTPTQGHSGTTTHRMHYKKIMPNEPRKGTGIGRGTLRTLNEQREHSMIGFGDPRVNTQDFTFLFCLTCFLMYFSISRPTSFMAFLDLSTPSVVIFMICVPNFFSVIS